MEYKIYAVAKGNPFTQPLLFEYLGKAFFGKDRAGANFGAELFPKASYNPDDDPDLREVTRPMLAFAATAVSNVPRT